MVQEASGGRTWLRIARLAGSRSASEPEESYAWKPLYHDSSTASGTCIFFLLFLLFLLFFFLFLFLLFLLFLSLLPSPLLFHACQDRPIVAYYPSKSSSRYPGPCHPCPAGPLRTTGIMPDNHPPPFIKIEDVPPPLFLCPRTIPIPCLLLI